DLVGVIHHALVNESVSGPLNAVAPQAVTNREFTRTLGTLLHRPTLFPLPGFVARIVLGEMANPLLLSSALVRPVKLEKTGYEFRFPELEPALRHALGRLRKPAWPAQAAPAQHIFAQHPQRQQTVAHAPPKTDARRL